MPYKDISEVPDNVPKDKRKQWIEIFNSSYEKAIKDKKDKKDAENIAFRNANGVIKKQLISNPLYIQLDSSNINEFKILYPGEFDHKLYGKFTITEDKIDNAIKNFKNKIGTRLTEDGNEPMLPGNYNHASYEKNPDSSKASHWIVDLFKKGKELWCKAEWTEKAKNFIKDKEFRFISPEFVENYEDEHGEKHGFTVLGNALTNVNFLKQKQPALVLTELENGDLVAYAELENFVTHTEMKGKLNNACESVYSLKQLLFNKINEGELNSLDDLIDFWQRNQDDLINNMRERFGDKAMLYTEPKKEVLKMELQEQLIEVLNLTEKDDIITTVKNLTETNAIFEKEKQDLDEEIKKLTEENKTLKEGKNKEITDLTVQLAEVQKTLAKNDAITEVEKFVLSATNPKGKLLPKQKDQFIALWINDPENTKSILENMQDITLTDEDQGSEGDQKKKDKEKPADIELNDKINELMSKETIEFADAQIRILQENPDLAERYKKQMDEK